MTDKDSFNLQDSFRENESQSLKRDLFRYLKYWKWIVFTVIISLAVSYVYLRYAPKIYKTDAKVKILKKKESGFDITGLTKNSPLFDMTKINLENEREIILSRRIIGEVVDELNLTSFYYQKGNIKDNIIFGNEVPIIVKWKVDSIQNSNSVKSNTFIFKRNDNTSFNIKIVDDPYKKNYKFGELISIDNLNFTIEKNPFYSNINPGTNQEIYFSYKKKSNVINSLRSKISIEQVGEDSEVLNLSISGQNSSKNEFILDELINKFNEDGVLDDRQIAIKTGDFVVDRLESIERDLDSVESNLVDFKKDSRYVNVSSDTDLIYSTYSSAEQKRTDLELQKQLSEYIQTEIENNETYSPIPANVGLENDNTNNFINQYNKLVFERNKLLTSLTLNSPRVKEISEQLDLLNYNIRESIKNYINSIQISIRNISNREYQYNSDRQDLPDKEKGQEK